VGETTTAGPIRLARWPFYGLLVSTAWRVVFLKSINARRVPGVCTYLGHSTSRHNDLNFRTCGSDCTYWFSKFYKDMLTA